MADMYSGLNQAIGDNGVDDDGNEITEEETPDPIYVWVVRRKDFGTSAKYVTKYESPSPERALEYFATELRLEYLADPDRETEQVDSMLQKYTMDRDYEKGFYANHDKAYYIKYLTGGTQTGSWYNRHNVQNPAIKATANGVTWRLYRSERKTAPVGIPKSQRDKLLSEFDDLMQKG